MNGSYDTVKEDQWVVRFSREGSMDRTCQLRRINLSYGPVKKDQWIVWSCKEGSYGPVQKDQ